MERRVRLQFVATMDTNKDRLGKASGSKSWRHEKLEGKNSLKKKEVYFKFIREAIVDDDEED